MKVNLLPKEDRPLRQTEVRWEFLVTLLGVLVLGAVLTFSIMEVSKVRELTRAREEALRQEDALQSQIQAVNALKSELAGLETKVDEYEELVDINGQSLAKLTVVLEHPFARLWIEALDWTASGVELQGYTQDLTSLSLYINYLRERSAEALLISLQPREGSDFLSFRLQVKGVGSSVAA